MSIDEQHKATMRAQGHRARAAEVAELAFRTEPALPTDIQISSGLACIVDLLLAIEDRLNYGSQSMLDGTISCRICRVILLEPNAEGHYKWHRKRGEE